MKRKIKFKNLISLILVLILLIALCIPSSYAIDTSKRRFGAWILSAIQALNITVQSTLAPAQSIIDAIGDPPGMVGVYQYPWEPDWDDDILNRSSIQLWPDFTEIDGVKYTDVWLSHDAAEKFRVNAFDWKTAYNIASESHGTFASGVGTVFGMPVYTINGEHRTQAVSFPNVVGKNNYSFGTGNLSTNVTRYSNALNIGNATANFGTYGNFSVSGSYASPTANPNFEFYLRNQQSIPVSGANFQPILNSSSGTSRSTDFVSQPFDFDWVSGVIPADEVLPQDTGLMIRVPSNSPGLQTFVNDNPEYTQPGGIELDFDTHPEIKITVDDLMDILAPIIPVLNTGDVEFIVNHSEPTPPIPDTPIIDATVPQVVQPIINEIHNQGDIISQSIPPIIESIPKIDEICNNIDTAPYHDLDTGLDRLPSFFLPFITDLRSALGIWHYVTEWIAQISTTFAFISGCLVGTSIMTPIYAAIAGFMCIKIYRRMTA